MDTQKCCKKMALPSSDVAQPPLSLMDYRSLLSGAASDQYHQKVEKLVSKLTSQNATALDMELVKQLKQSLKVSEKRVAYAYDLLFEQVGIHWTFIHICASQNRRVK